MNKNSNLYIFLYASIMVIVVAAILSFAAMSLQPMQELNMEIEKKSDILMSVGKAEKASEVDDKNSYIVAEYEKYITKGIVVDYQGNIVEGVDPFTVDLKVEQAKPLEEQNLPLYYATLDNGESKIVVPLLGKGLWGPIWGYLALNEDYNTVYGAIFDHKGETPGLGAEINTDWFEEPFKGEELFENGEFVSIKTVKGGADPQDLHGVDAISGGTITSKGLEAMLYDCLKNYVAYFKKQMN